MSETLRTKKIKNALLNHFNSYKNKLSYILVSPEVFCNNGQCRCDLAGFEYYKNKPDASVGIEIKQSYGDFYSGYGLNFVFDVNYICVPSELVGEAIIYLKNHELSDVGIIEYLEYNNALRLIKKPSYNFRNSINRNNCIKSISQFDNMYDIPESVYSFKKTYKKQFFC